MSSVGVEGLMEAGQGSGGEPSNFKKLLGKGRGQKGPARCGVARGKVLRPGRARLGRFGLGWILGRRTACSAATFKEEAANVILRKKGRGDVSVGQVSPGRGGTSGRRNFLAFIAAQRMRG